MPTTGIFLLPTTQNISIIRIMERKEDTTMRKNLFKKVLAGALALALGVTALAGCGNGNDNKSAEAKKNYRTVEDIKKATLVYFQIKTHLVM